MIKPINKSDIWKIQKVAHRTWPPTFKGILSDQQLYYMLDLMYSSSSLVKQLNDGCIFETYENQGIVLGFIGYQPMTINHEEVIKIHKLYVDPEFQNQSVGKALLLKSIHLAKKAGIKKIVLNVNRFNDAVGFYKYFGFKIIDTVNIDIGNGFLMEDYVMQYTI